MGADAAQSRAWDEAVRWYDRALAARPDHADSHYKRGNALKELGRLDEALAAYDRALECRNDFGYAWCNRGVVLELLQRADEALSSYDRAVRHNPADALAHYNRGRVLRSLLRFEEALASFECALKAEPRYAEACFSRGLLLQELGRATEALASYDAAAAQNPGHFQTWFNRGHVLRTLGQLDAALISFEKALTLQDSHAESHYNRGVLLERKGDPEGALASYARAVERAADFHQAHFNSAGLHRQKRQPDAALASYGRAIAARPDYAEAYLNRGVLLQEQGRWEEARSDYDQALRLRPDYAEALYNRGTLFDELRQWRDAVHGYDAAISLRPGYAEAHFNVAHSLLLGGEYARGWAEYEWRWITPQTRTSLDRRGFAQPLWLGDAPLAGRTILLHSEQGLGDTLQFCRYVGRVAAAGARVVLEAPGTLLGVLTTLEGVAQLVARGDPLPAFDTHCPLMSLPLACRTTVATIPAEIPYLRAIPEKARHWREHLGERRGPRVGIVWSGGFRPDQPETWGANIRRNITLEKLAGLPTSGIDYVSLQKGEPAESELAELEARQWGGPPIRNFADVLHDFSDTAALIENLDLVISVDTSTAHLAGAMGKPVWLMNRFDTCWRWFLGRSDSPWYPTLRLYRQPRPGDWDSVISAICRDLRALAQMGADGPAASAAAGAQGLPRRAT